AGTGDRPAVRAARGISGAQGQRELRQAPEGPGRSGGTSPVRPAVLQRRRARLQRRHPADTRRAGRPRHGLWRCRVLPGRGSRARGPRTGPAPMTRLLLLLLALAWMLPAAAEDGAGERIVDYDVDIAIQADGSLE